MCHVVRLFALHCHCGCLLLGIVLLVLSSRSTIPNTSKPVKCLRALPRLLVVTHSGVLCLGVCVYCRASVKTGGLTFGAVRPSDPALWDVQVEPGSETSHSVSVVCQRKSATTAKRLPPALH